MIKNMFLPLLALIVVMNSCSNSQTSTGSDSDSTSSLIKLMTLDPGHFHAALVQKNMYEGVDSVVHVYAPEGDDVQQHLKRIEAFNTRAENPTHWQEKVYTGDDFFQKMLNDKPGNVVVLAGNNQKKTEYIKASIDAGLNVLADKPMAITYQNFELLKEAFASAEKNKVLLYDIMTERYEITSILQREFSLLPEVFGTLQKGTPEDPAITKESVHHFFKYVSGAPIKRPGWYFDVTQQGEGIADVTTHLVDLIQWECFPDQVIQYENDIKITNARRWKTILKPSEFKKVTGMDTYPDYLKKDLEKDSLLGVYSNGEINYQIKGVNAKISVIWNYEAPEGAGDTHYSIMKGTKANLVIRQGSQEKYKPQLYIEPVKGVDIKDFEASFNSALSGIQKKFPGVVAQKKNNGWMIIAPEKYHNGHEAHFGEVTAKYLQFLRSGKMPDWEVPNMLAKYYTITKALEIAKQ
ncbi:MAG TPA: putative oxidoreductase C-terminal domain-containing protein [Sphingobacteriaceae bacterium]